MNFSAVVSSPLSNLTYADLNYGTSSSISLTAVSDEREALGESFSADQPPPRRRTYGRPRYADNLHNADGSTKYAFEVGGGFAAPAGSTSNYNTLSYKFSVGGGLNFNKNFGVLLQYDYDHFSVSSAVLSRMASFYSAANIDPTGLDGNTHLWSLTVNPIISFQGAGRTGAYVVFGGGYYRKTTNFTLPTSGCYYDYYVVTSNQTFDRYTNGAFGGNGGIGITYKLSDFSSNRLFAEARYVWVNNNSDSSNSGYPPNAYRTGYFPVTVGLRW